MSIYLVCMKIYVDNTLYDNEVLKVFDNLRNAEKEVERRADLCIMGDSKWWKSEQDEGYAELKNGNAKRVYYILKKFLEKSVED